MADFRLLAKTDDARRPHEVSPPDGRLYRFGRQATILLRWAVACAQRLALATAWLRIGSTSRRFSATLPSDVDGLRRMRHPASPG